MEGAMINQIIIQGRIVDNPETRKKDDTIYLHFTLASHRDNNKDIADFVDCVCFNKTAENLSKYITKGDKITVIGSLETSSYIDKNNVKRKSTNVNVSKIYYPDKSFSENEDYSDIPIPEGE